MFQFVTTPQTKKINPAIYDFKFSARAHKEHFIHTERQKIIDSFIVQCQSQETVPKLLRKLLLTRAEKEIQLHHQ